MKYYKLMFSEQTLGRPIYFDVAQDTLCLTSSKALRAFYGRRMNVRWLPGESELDYMLEVENSVRFLAMNCCLNNYSSPQFNAIARFSCLEGLTMANLGTTWGDSRFVVETLMTMGCYEASREGMIYSEPHIKYVEPVVFASQFLPNSNS
jgi:hypothetical protein